jgi:SSS family solute:Na+ symporter
LLGWNYDASLWICSAVVLVYVLKGGLTSAIYTEVLAILHDRPGFRAGGFLGFKDMGGWDAIKSKLVLVAQNPAALSLNDKTSNPTPGPARGSRCWPVPAPIRWAWMCSPSSSDLGFVLSFGYWCTNFLVVQRAMAAKDMTAARRTPLIAAIPKMVFPVLVILPGIIAIALASTPDKGLSPAARRPSTSGAYSAGLADIKAGQAGGRRRGFAKVSKDIGLKLDKAKIAALMAEIPRNI